jgi:hypothetical protein
MWASTIGSTFEGADFSGAKKFFLCREILVEILRREIADDFERVELVGAIAVGSRWCYPQWKQILESRPKYRDLAMEIFKLTRILASIMHRRPVGSREQWTPVAVQLRFIWISRNLCRSTSQLLKINNTHGAG